MMYSKPEEFTMDQNLNWVGFFGM
uniref:Uncharacterized protein n=1 Tax=Anguilla anguilla TaxID=7936 RepID=A0A0E9TSK4_ANGAN